MIKSSLLCPLTFSNIHSSKYQNFILYFEINLITSLYMDRNKATGYAIDALLWLADNEQSLEVFLSASGANAEDLRVRAKDPEFLAFVLDFFMTSDELIISLSEKINISPEQLDMARSALSGGNLPNWT